MLGLIRRLLGKHKKQGGFVEHRLDALSGEQLQVQWVKHYPLFERLPRKPYEPTEQVVMVRTARYTWQPMMVDWGKDKEKRG